MKLKVYYAAFKPERTYANVMTTAAGFLFASQWHFSIKILTSTIVGTTLIVLSACAVNNCTDRGLDALMPRTKKRGTVTGEVAIPKLAIVAAICGTTGFILLLKDVNLLTSILGLIAYFDYVVLYAWSKRYTPWSTLIGTVSGAIPLIAGYTAVTNRLDTTALLLGLIMVFWQMVHFYAIAIFRCEDYLAGKIPVWPNRHGIRNTQVWMLAYAVMYVVSVATLIIAGKVSPYFTVVGILGVWWIYRGIRNVRWQNHLLWARGMFNYSLVILSVLSVGFAINSLLP